MDLLLGGSLGGLVFLFLFVLAVLWFLLPFAIFGTKDILKDLSRESEKTNELLVELIAAIKGKEVPDSNSKFEENKIEVNTNHQNRQDLISKLEANKNDIGFSKTQKKCEVCQETETGQIIHNHYVCSKCRTKYLS